MGEVLLAWVGNTDLKAAGGDESAGLGPIGQAVTACDYDHLVLLYNYPTAKVEPYVARRRRPSS